jgi:predicted AAA+ superfamily ATPase
MQRTNHQRPVYLDRIKPYIEKNLIKVLTGLRRVGKSYILRQLIAMIEKDQPNANILYINKEDIAFDNIRDYQELNAYIAHKTINHEMNYIFIDEVQLIDKFHLTLKSSMSRGKESPPL